MFNTKHIVRLLAILLCVGATGIASADYRGGMRQGYGGYYGPRGDVGRHSSPFFVQPYSRGNQYYGHDGYSQHGYRHGYNDGYYDRGDRHRGRWCPPGDRGGYRGGYGRGDGWNRGYQQSPYYGPRSGFSFYYQN
jgi:hypothetical protein